MASWSKVEFFLILKDLTHFTFQFRYLPSFDSIMFRNITREGINVSDKGGLLYFWRLRTHYLLFLNALRLPLLFDLLEFFALLIRSEAILTHHAYLIVRNLSYIISDIPLIR
jgi:hypothetical protein